MTIVPLVHYRLDNKQRVVIGNATVNENTGEVETTNLLQEYKWCLDDPEIRNEVSFRLTWGAGGVTEAVLMYHPTPAIRHVDLLDATEYERRKNAMLSSEEIENRLGYHKGTTDGPYPTAPIHRDIRNAAITFMNFLNRTLPEGRAKDIALKEFETAMMWANRSVAEKAPLIPGG